MDNNKWLKDLKAGDLVIVSPGASYNSDYVATVTYTTATQVHIGGTKYDRANGREKGANSWHRSRLEQATPAAIEAIRLREEIGRLVRKFADLNWRKLPIDALEQIERIIAANQKEEGKQ